MGLSKLVLIGSEGHRSSDARMMGYSAEDILADVQTFPTLKDGLKGMGAVFGVTGRQRKERKIFITPRETSDELIKLSSRNKVAIVFGTERTGLTNEELRLCHQIITIPTGEAFTSLNLSQAVLIVCYEIFLASHMAKGGTLLNLARSETVEAMFQDMKETFLRIGFLNPQSPDFILSGMRSFLGRASLTQSDIKILRGMIRHIDEYCTGGRSRRLELKRISIDGELMIGKTYEICGESLENLKKWEPRVGEAITVADKEGREGRARILEQTKEECRVYVFEHSKEAIKFARQLHNMRLRETLKLVGKMEGESKGLKIYNLDSGVPYKVAVKVGYGVVKMAATDAMNVIGLKTKGRRQAVQKVTESMLDGTISMKQASDLTSQIIYSEGLGAVEFRKFASTFNQRFQRYVSAVLLEYLLLF